MGNKLSQIDYPIYKVAFFSSMWNSNRAWAIPQYRWHGQGINSGHIPASFVDGHAENFDIWWRPSDQPPSGINIDRDGYY